jgi:RNA polymerase sigma-70 factor, ECF subfamily
MQAVNVLAVPEKVTKTSGGKAREAARSKRASTPSKPAQALAEMRDVELLNAFREGDERAFGELYNRYKAEIYTFCLRMLGGDSAEAGDAYQETFIKVYEKSATFTYGENVRGWLYMIARNVALNVYRAKRPEETINSHPNLASSERRLSPEFYGEQSSLREALEEAIGMLPHEFREPFILREFDGLGYPEIANITGATLSLVKIRIHRAKQRLRKMLAPLLADEMHSAHAMLGTVNEESEE